MLEVLLFSFSISIDAFGYSFGFGTRNIKLTKFEFLVLNIINSLILSVMLIGFSNLNFLFKYKIFEKISSVSLIIFGFIYLIQSFVDIFKRNKKHNLSNGDLYLRQDYFKLRDLFLMLIIFIFENAFSSFVFHSRLSNQVLFILSNFMFHYLFFIVGFDLGAKIIKKININTSYISGLIFILLGIFNL